MFQMAEGGEEHINDNEKLFVSLWIFESQILLT